MNPDEAEKFARDNNSIGMVPAAIFTAGLDFDQEVTLQTIAECMDRGQHYTMELAKGNEEMLHKFEPLRRILTGIATGSVIPILKRISEGAEPAVAFKEVLAGVGGLMFFGGIEYAKAMGLDGVGVKVPKKDYGEDEYPEEKPASTGDLKKDLAHLEQLLAQIETDEDGRDE